MQRKAIGVLSGSILVVLLAVALVAVGPTRLLSLANPGTNPATPGPGGDDGPTPRPMAVEKPTWNVGDSWTYSASASGEERPGTSLGMATLTRTVESVDADVVNVSVTGSFRAHWTLAPDNPHAAGSIMLDYAIGFRDATITGYTWYRASDLATLKEVRSIEFQGSVEMQANAYSAMYRATVETTYDPALDVWSFPLNANEAWTATSTATVHASAQWSIDTPTEPWVLAKDVTFTRDVRLSLVTGAPQDIVTPAGTFPSIPVRLGTPHVEILSPPNPGADAGDLAGGLEEDVPVPRERTSVAWFSDAAKNVVMVTFSTGGYRMDLALVEYNVS